MPDRVSNHVVRLMKILAAGALLAVAVVATSALMLFGNGESGSSGGGQNVASAAEVSAAGPYRTRQPMPPDVTRHNAQVSRIAGQRAYASHTAVFPEGSAAVTTSLPSGPTMCVTPPAVPATFPVACPGATVTFTN